MEYQERNKQPAKFVHSGLRRRGTLGDETPLVDVCKEKLYVGDIVIDLNRFGIIGGLTVVVSDQYTSTSNGFEVEHVAKKGDISYFVMGFRGVDFPNIDNKRPRDLEIKKVKSFKDVVDGEKWTDYGFNYRAD